MSPATSSSEFDPSQYQRWTLLKTTANCFGVPVLREHTNSHLWRLLFSQTCPSPVQVTNMSNESNSEKATDGPKKKTEPQNEPGCSDRQLPFRFLDLPGEIRNLIYAYVLALPVRREDSFQNAVGQTFFKQSMKLSPDSRERSFVTVVPQQPGFYTPWTTWLCGSNSLGEDCIIVNELPAILRVSRAVAQEARGYWLKLPLFFELHDVRYWRNYKVSDRVQLMQRWVDHQSVDRLRNVKLVRVAVNYEVEDDRGTERVEGVEIPSGEHDSDNDDFGWLRCRRALFDVERTADSILIKGGCMPTRETQTNLQQHLEDALSDMRAVTVQDLFRAAAAVEAFSCIYELRMLAKKEDCVTKNGSDFFLSYADWKIVATILSHARYTDE
ncbi:uncharacterized protein PV09_06107 [Verruconis gallopava]|uniref:F-box domain-containing protein n=1 Tax=Verruconis gallopava TaxID=253628 RepID=A0A0D2A7W7_9PEZI|nr:uncharacterized protein PV09_06107 [Verruconis gallopava]KIW02670.1 hypothetical protein PV09_06107 [Verruconis gallopava]